jgi:hypothetical protein
MHKEGALQGDNRKDREEVKRGGNLPVTGRGVFTNRAFR